MWAVLDEIAARPVCVGVCVFSFCLYFQTCLVWSGAMETSIFNALVDDAFTRNSSRLLCIVTL